MPHCRATQRSVRARIDRWGLLAILGALLAGCASLPPGSDYAKAPSAEIPSANQSQLGREFARVVQEHQGISGFRLITVGVDGLLMRLELINGAERTLDLQYYIFHADESGRLVADALARAADRGVRVRVLVDDGETVAGDGEQLLTLAQHPNVEVRIFNPWAYRGHEPLMRALEFSLHKSRLDYRMHNKLFIADDALALVGGRNIGDQYFQIDPESQLADDDVFVAGPAVPQLGATFDDFWNSKLAIPTAALYHDSSAPQAPTHDGPAVAQKATQAGFDYQGKLASGEPLADIVSGKAPLFWGHAVVACDSPDKKQVVEGDRIGSLMYKPVYQAVQATRRELLLISPYFVPSAVEMRLLEDRLQQHVRVAVLTNSLESSPDPSAQSGYMHYRVPLLKAGAEIHEVRALLDTTRGSGQSKHISSYGNYGLHGKLIVFDRSKLFVGSMNFDQRSRYLNTEVGLIIDSRELSEQAGARFDAMTQLGSSYALALRPDPGGGTHLVWRTEESGQLVELDKEPARSSWQRFEIHLLGLLPIEPEL